MKIKGHSLVLEEDGTLVDDEQVLLYVNNKPLLLLTMFQMWRPVSEELPTTPVSSSEDGGQVISIVQEDKSEYANEVNFEIIVWEDFQIPWSMMAPSTLKNFETGRGTRQEITTLVHATVKMLREIAETVPMHAITFASNNLVQKYPRLFQDRDDVGHVIDKGNHTVYHKLRSRYFFVLRNTKRLMSIPTENHNPPKKSKNDQADPADCDATESNNAEINDLSLQEKLNKYTQAQADDEFLNLLQLCFEDLSAYLNKRYSPDVKDVLNDWPVLFKSETIEWYFEKTTGKNLHDVGKILSEKAAKILQALYNDKDPFVPVVTAKHPGSLNALERISVHLKEDLTFLFEAKNINVIYFYLQFIFSNNYLF